MGPDRTRPARRHGKAQIGDGGNAEAGPSRSTHPEGRKNPPPFEKRDPGGIPGISKLKASIRQTKRFLAKDTLDPALRITTERRLVSLEADLATAQRREVEKKNGSKYHQVKFFEKRKLLRIIKKLKRTLAEEKDGKGKKKAEKELGEARIMLNYVRHYPNTQKYISLFPTDSSEVEDDESRVLKLPKLFKKSKSTDGEEDESTTKRREVLDRIKGMMDSGALPVEPELVVGADKEKAGQVDIGSKEVKVKAKKEAKEEEDDFFDVDE